MYQAFQQKDNKNNRYNFFLYKIIKQHTIFPPFLAYFYFCFNPLTYENTKINMFGKRQQQKTQFSCHCSCLYVCLCFCLWEPPSHGHTRRNGLKYPNYLQCNARYLYPLVYDPISRHQFLYNGKVRPQCIGEPGKKSFSNLCHQVNGGI